jgi:hypothetical protein
LLLFLLSCLLCLYFYWSRDHSSFAVGLYSRYSDSLLAGSFGARILVGAKFSVLSRPTPRPTQRTMGTGSFPGVKRPVRDANFSLLQNVQTDSRTQPA